MNKYKTKRFGEIAFMDHDAYLSAHVKYKKHSICVFVDKSIYTKGANDFLNLLDKYSQIKAAAKKAVFDNFSKNRFCKGDKKIP
ncbi:MAG: hypothetical protein LBU19_11175 [Treponema sp.]|jgi:hypothetical protein|nr:hypothetical protein [Treponema sp.]